MGTKQTVRAAPAGLRLPGTSSGAPLYLLAALGVGIFTLITPVPALAGLTVLAIGATAALLLAWQLPLLRAPILVAFLLRAGLALVQVFVVPLPGSGGDALRFDRIAWGWALDTSVGLWSRIGSGSTLYIWFMAVGYRLAERSELLILGVNVVLSTLIVWHTYQLAMELGADSTARWAAWWTALFPTLALYSAVMLREVVVAYPLILGAVWFARWRLTRRTLWFGAAIGAFLASAAFHTGSVVPLGVTVLFFLSDWMRSVGQGRVLRVLAGVLGLSLVAGVGVVVYGAGVGLDKLSLIQDFSPEALGDYQEVAARSRAAYLSWLTVRGPWDLLWQLPIRMVYYLFSPFPWMVRSPADLIGLLDASLYIWLVWVIWRGRERVRSNRAARGVAWLTLAIVIVFSIATSNYGTAIRHRGKTAPLLIALAAIASTRQAEQVSGEGRPT